MVVFTCNHCGESLHKPKVAKHYQFNCRRQGEDLTCVDCLKDFRGQEYVAHTKCISENERYGGEGYTPKSNRNKGEKKQTEWINVVQNLLNDSQNLSPAEKNFLCSMKWHENLPRKKAKFLNFVKNTYHSTFSEELLDSVWDKMEGSLKKAIAKNAEEKGETDSKGKKRTHEAMEGKDDSEKNESKENLGFENAENSQNVNGKSGKKQNKNKNKKATEKTLDPVEENASKMEVYVNQENGNMQKEDVPKKKKDKKNKKAKNQETVPKVTEDSREKDAVQNGGSENPVTMEVDDNQENRDLEKAEVPKKKKDKKNKKAKNQETVSEVIDNSEKVSKKDKKRGLDKTKNEEEQLAKKANSEVQEKSGEKFDLKKSILEIVKNSKEISLKKLKKKIIPLYMENSSATREEADSKFDKKIAKISKICIEDNKARML